MAKVKPANDLGIISVEDILGTTVTGTNKADTLTFDIRSQHGTDPAHTTTLDGGNGDDALTLRLTQSQLAALTAETHLTLDANNAITGAALDLFSGNHPTTLTSIDLTVKSWQTVYIEVYPDPPPSWAGGDFSAVGHSIDLNLAAHTLEFEENTPPRADVADGSDAATYFDGGTATPGLNLLRLGAEMDRLWVIEKEIAELDQTPQLTLVQ